MPSRAFERLGDNRKALGERDKALEYYRWYLAYRRDPEPALRAERDAVKRAVAQLESKGR